MSLISRTLGDICDEIGGTIRTGPFGSQLHESDYTEQGTPIVMPKNIIDGRISIEDIARIGDNDTHRLLQHKLHVGDIVYGRRGDIGRRGLITKREDGWICGTGCLRISLGHKILDPTFLYYYLGDSKVISWVANQAIGATLPNLNTTIIRSIRVSYPPLPTQHKIASILSAYDDLIENNTRRIAILEEMAQTIYQEWFVHFRYPGHEENKMVESELGMIPKGWEIVTFRDVSKFINRGISPKYNETSDGIVINQRCIRDGKLNLEVARTHCTQVSDTKRVKFGDVLINSTGVGTLGRLTQVYQDIINCTADSHVTIVRPEDNVTLEYFGHYALDYQPHFARSGVGSTGQTELSRESIANTIFLKPPIELQQTFTNIVSPLKRNIINLLEKYKVLIRTRDLLLPKLMSGEIDVETLDIDIPDIPEPEAQQTLATFVQPEPIDASQLAFLF